jgi:NADPH-dependent 2,4-dienoyl-CoA reductase/sulfur reductase-like enzyme
MAKISGNSVTESERTIQVYQKVDVVVAGGGPAGFAAAVSAARNGAKVREILAGLGLKIESS